MAEGFYCSQRVVEASRGRRGWRGRPVKVGASRSGPQQRGFTARKEAKPVCKQLHRWSTCGGRGYAAARNGGGTLVITARGYPGGDGA